MMKRPIGLYRNVFNQMTTVKQLRDWNRKKYASISRTIETRTDRTNEYIFPREQPLEDVLPPSPPHVLHGGSSICTTSQPSSLNYTTTTSHDGTAIACSDIKHQRNYKPKNTCSIRFQILPGTLFTPLGSSVNRPLRDVDTTTFCSSSSSNSSSRS